MIKYKLRGTVGAATLMLLLGAPAYSATVIVTPATLASAFETATAGETLRLVGTFGETRLQGRSFSKLVTLDASRALFTNTLILEHDSNVKLSGGQFNVTGGSSYNRAIAVWGGSNIVVDRTIDTGNGNEVGIDIEGTANATVSNSRLDGFRAGIGLASVTGGTAYRNTITHAVADGIDIGDSHNVTASYNSCSLGTPGAGVHPDCIQLWSVAGRAVQSDITVTRNTATGPTQGFTSFSAGGGALRVTITHNSVTSSFPQGVACYDCVDSNISYNSLATLAGAAHFTNINIVGGSNNTVVGNVFRSAPVVHAAFASAVFALAQPESYNPALHASSLGKGVNTSVGGVPEPTTWAMLIAGFAAIGVARRRVSRMARAVA